ncbi:MAG: radical SAM protein [Candidatus Omnitrophota bacterium]|nr:radical SAM protein [Candidatus Omnitrophota bacterium]
MKNIYKEVAEEQTRESLKIGFSCFGVTDDCMLRCKMCEKWKKDIFTIKPNLTTLDDWKKAALSLRSLVNEGFEIDIGGGEALLMKELWDLVKYCVNLGFRMNIATNGYLIDEDTAKKISDSGLQSIIISLDSLKAETHDSMRGVDGVFSRVMKAIDYLYKYSPDIHIGLCSIIMEKNLDDIIDLALWATNNPKIKSILFMAVMQPNNTLPKEEWYKEEFDYLWPKDIKKVQAVFDGLIRFRRMGYRMGNSTPQLLAFKSYYQDPNKFVKKSACNMDRAVHISSVGDIFICYRWPCLGNITTDELAKVLTSEEANRVRQDIRNCKENCHFLLNCFYDE